MRSALIAFLRCGKVKSFLLRLITQIFDAITQINVEVLSV